jgi:hypothetical protein
MAYERSGMKTCQSYELPSVAELEKELRLAYNLSPSFNWKAAMSPEKQETFIERLGQANVEKRRRDAKDGRQSVDSLLMRPYFVHA